MSHGTHTIASLLLTCVLLGAAACTDTRADREIAGKVDRELSNSPVLGSAQIDVAARGGVVTLTGVAASEEQVASAEKLAWSVEGVQAVESRIRVSPSPEPTGLPPVGAPPVDPGDEVR